MTTKMILLSANAYNMKDRQTGDTVKGLTMFFYPADSLNPTEKPLAQEMEKGKKPMKVNLPYDYKEKVSTVPGLYECHLDMRTTTDGKAQLTVADFHFLNTLETKLTKT